MMMVTNAISRFMIPACAALLTVQCSWQKQEADKPNVIFIITDDQGYGDLAGTGNPWIKTPNLDQLAEQSIVLRNFHTGTTCAPTRAGIMTGRHNNRVGVWHTVMGRSLLHKDEITLADVFKENGYATGLFGKWHLGDNYPYRPHERGFDEAFYHGSGGVFQITDYWDNDYFDDTYFRNGVPEQTNGYCTDVWFSNAFDFIERHQEQPFFCYISTNAPHDPFFAPQQYIDMYSNEPNVVNPEFYGMITNIDDNIGLLRQKMQEMNIADNTILIFMTDNGTSAGMEMDENQFLTSGYNAGMRGRKGSKYNGGHRVPFFIYWKDGQISGGKNIDKLTSFMDIMPTLLDLCTLDHPDIDFDGQSIKPLLYGEENYWPDRVIITDTQREDTPVKWKQCAIMTEKWHLIDGKELYDMENDPGQVHDVSDNHPERVQFLRSEYERWWEDISPSFAEYPEIIIDMQYENPVVLTSHDTHTPVGLPVWNQVQVREGMHNMGYWVVDFALPGTYEFEIRRWPKEADQLLNASLPPTEPVPGSDGYPEGVAVDFVSAGIRIGDQTLTKTTEPDAKGVTFSFDVHPGETQLQAWLTDSEGVERGAYYVYVTQTR